MSVETLNARFKETNRIEFHAGPNDLVFARLSSDHGQADVFLNGGHVTDLVLNGESILWLSPEANYLPGKAIRGGIPICWPWFGPHPDNPDLQSHGFARNLPWEVAATSSTDNCTAISLLLESNDQTKKLWPHEFRLKLTVELDHQLRVSLKSTNLNESEPVVVGGALHSYFSLDNIDNARLSGLDSVSYADQLDALNICQQAGPITFDREVDRVYLATDHAVTLQDGARKVLIEKSGSQSTVVWNPWIEKATRIGDMPNDAYQRMVCVETSNALKDVRTLKPGESHQFQQTISLATDE